MPCIRRTGVVRVDFVGSSARVLRDSFLHYLGVAVAGAGHVEGLQVV